MTQHEEDRSPFAFFILTFIYSWGLWLPSLLAGYGIDTGFNEAAIILQSIGAFAPLLAALTLIVRRHGWREAGRFMGQAFDFRTRPIYYLLALAIPLLIVVGAHYIAPLLNLQVATMLFPEEYGNPWLLAIPYFIFIGMVGGGQEEFGWRGYAQLPLQQRYGVVKASLLIGAIWGFWHLPLWAMIGDPHTNYPFLAFVIQTAAISVIYGLLYNASGRKLIIPILIHAMNNTAPGLFPYTHWIDGKAETAFWVYTGLSVLAAILAVYFVNRREKTARVIERVNLT